MGALVAPTKPAPFLLHRCVHLPWLGNVQKCLWRPRLFSFLLLLPSKGQEPLKFNQGRDQRSSRGLGQGQE